jgi:hypothetical protein
MRWLETITLRYAGSREKREVMDLMQKRRGKVSITFSRVGFGWVWCGVVWKYVLEL